MADSSRPGVGLTSEAAHWTRWPLPVASALTIAFFVGYAAWLLFHAPSTSHLQGDLSWLPAHTTWRWLYGRLLTVLLPFTSPLLIVARRAPRGPRRMLALWAASTLAGAACAFSAQLVAPAFVAEGWRSWLAYVAHPMTLVGALLTGATILTLWLLPASIYVYVSRAEPRALTVIAFSCLLVYLGALSILVSLGAGVWLAARRFVGRHRPGSGRASGNPG